MAPRYSPPIKWASTEVPWLSLVLKADPDFERRRHREAEYAFSSGRVFRADPYRRGAYETPERTVTVDYAGPVVLSAGDITGVGFDIVVLVSENVAPGTFTTRSAAQMYADIGADAVPGVGQLLRVVNNAIGGWLTLAPGAGVIFNDISKWQVGSYAIRPQSYSDFTVQFPDPGSCVFGVSSQNGTYSALVG